MTIQDAILEIRSLKKEIRAIRSLLSVISSEDWVSEKEAAEIAGVSLKTIQKLRYKGMVGKWRVRPTGRGVQYYRPDIKKLFTQNS